MRHATAFMLLVACGGVACGGAGSSESAPSDTETVAIQQTEGAESAGSVAEADRPPLSDLHEGDQLTYLVRTGDAREEEARLRVEKIVDRGGSRAVKLSPVGVPGEAGQVFIAWIVADHAGLAGLEAHVSLGEPGFVPIDEAGELVTEAESNVAWRVPARWLELETRAFQNDPVAGWRLVDSARRIDGPVRMVHCVDLERREGVVSHHMKVCRNVGIIGLSVTPEPLEEREVWELVDLGEAPDELAPSLAAPPPTPADQLQRPAAGGDGA